MYTILIVDDERPAQTFLKAICQKYCPAFDTILLSGSADDALRLMAQQHVHVLVTDISMPGINGIELAQRVRQLYPRTHTVIVSGYAEFEFARGAIQAGVDDYLLKPVAYERLAQLLDELSSMRPSATDELVIKTSFGYHALRLSDIEYAEARNKHVVFHLRDGRDIEALESFRSVEDRLAQNATFFKCHRSYQVNLRNIDHFDRTDIVMRSGACIPLSRSCKQGFQDAYFAARFEGGKH